MHTKFESGFLGSEAHCDHGGIVCLQICDIFLHFLLSPEIEGTSIEKINHHQIGTPSCIKKVTKKPKNKNFKYGVYMHYFDHTTPIIDNRIKFFYFIRSHHISHIYKLCRSFPNFCSRCNTIFRGCHKRFNLSVTASNLFYISCDSLN